MKKIGLYLIMVGCALMAKAQTEVSRYVPGVTVEGVTYCLPKTALRFVVTAEKEVFTPGELHKYADRYLRVSDARSEADVKWTVKDIDVEAYGQPDTAKFYSIAFRSKTISPFVTLARDGRILAIRDEGKDIELSPLPTPTAFLPWICSRSVRVPSSPSSSPRRSLRHVTAIAPSSAASRTTCPRTASNSR